MDGNSVDEFPIGKARDVHFLRCANWNLVVALYMDFRYTPAPFIAPFRKRQPVLVSSREFLCYVNG